MTNQVNASGGIVGRNDSPRTGISKAGDAAQIYNVGNCCEAKHINREKGLVT